MKSSKKDMKVSLKKKLRRSILSFLRSNLASGQFLKLFFFLKEETNIDLKF